MRYKAVCEELWSILGHASGCLLYGETKVTTAVWRLVTTRSRETRRIRDNNNNRHPRSEARYHMGPRTHVPAGITLFIDGFSLSLVRRRSGTSCTGSRDAAAEGA
jgi:hypothetical protein